MRHVLVLIGVSLVVWTVAALIARNSLGDAVIVTSGAALALCVVPAALSLAWARYSWRQSADSQLTMLLGGTGLRLFATVGGAFTVVQFVPYIRNHPETGFWLWLGSFYLLTLALETWLSLAGRPGNARESLPAGGVQPVNR